MTGEKLDMRGHMTMLDGSHVALSQEEITSLLDMVEITREQQAIAFPTTHDALRGFIDVEERMRELGWKKSIFNLEDGDELAVCEYGSTGIFNAFWYEPYLHYCDCVSSMGKVFIKRVADLTLIEGEQMKKCSDDHAVFMEAQTLSMQRLHAIMGGEYDGMIKQADGVE